MEACLLPRGRPALSRQPNSATGDSTARHLGPNPKHQSNALPYTSIGVSQQSRQTTSFEWNGYVSQERRETSSTASSATFLEGASFFEEQEPLTPEKHPLRQAGLRRTGSLPSTQVSVGPPGDKTWVSESEGGRTLPAKFVASATAGGIAHRSGMSASVPGTREKKSVDHYCPLPSAVSSRPLSKGKRFTWHRTKSWRTWRRPRDPPAIKKRKRDVTRGIHL